MPLQLRTQFPTNIFFQRKNEFRLIGKGNCGSVWTLGDSTWVIKREDGSVGRSIDNDRFMHNRLLAANHNHDLPIRIPSSYEIIESNDACWNGAIFPSSTEPCRAYRQERIPALPFPTRTLLIETYYPDVPRVHAREYQTSKDCAIRLYTGKRCTWHSAPRQVLTLPNFALHVDQMEDLHLDKTSIAIFLADALAHCYWRAHVDANGVEFVLAPPTSSPTASTPVFNFLGAHCVIWMLDYDGVCDMSQGEEGVRQAVQAFHGNDPYFPRPWADGHTEADCALWEAFKARFLETSRVMMEQRGGRASLPALWVGMVEEEGCRRWEADVGDLGMHGLSLG